jgi:hypothetical protein
MSLCEIGAQCTKLAQKLREDAEGRKRPDFTKTEIVDAADALDRLFTIPTSSSPKSTAKLNAAAGTLVWHAASPFSELCRRQIAERLCIENDLFTPDVGPLGEQGEGLSLRGDERRESDRVPTPLLLEGKGKMYHCYLTQSASAAGIGSVLQARYPQLRLYPSSSASLAAQPPAAAASSPKSLLPSSDTDTDTAHLPTADYAALRLSAVVIVFLGKGSLRNPIEEQELLAASVHAIPCGYLYEQAGSVATLPIECILEKASVGLRDTGIVDAILRGERHHTVLLQMLHQEVGVSERTQAIGELSLRMVNDFILTAASQQDDDDGAISLHSQGRIVAVGIFDAVGLKVNCCSLPFYSSCSLRVWSTTTQCQFVVSMGNLVHETQKERGASTIFLGYREKRANSLEHVPGLSNAVSEVSDSQTAAAAERLQNQRRLTDEVWAVFDSIAGQVSTQVGDEKTSGSEKNVRKEELELFRSQMDAKGSAFVWHDAWRWFSDFNEKCITTGQQSFTNSETQESSVSKKVNGVTTLFICFVRMKEQIGMERALVGGILATGIYSDGHALELARILAKQEAYAITIELLMPQNSAAATVRFQDYQAAGYTIEAIRVRSALVAQGAEAAVELASPAQWYVLMTQRIDMVRKIELQLAGAIKKAAIHALKGLFTGQGQGTGGTTSPGATRTTE